MKLKVIAFSCLACVTAITGYQGLNNRLDPLQVKQAVMEEELIGSDGVDMDSIVSAIPETTPLPDYELNQQPKKSLDLDADGNSRKASQPAYQGKLKRVLDADPGLEPAVARARNTFFRFVELMDASPSAFFFIKFPAEENGKIDNVWMEIRGFHNNRFFGHVSSQPKGLPSLHKGDWVEVELDQVEDWMVKSEGLIFGAYTTRYLLKDVPAQQADAMNHQFRD